MNQLKKILFVLFLVFCAIGSNLTKTVRSSGGDYTSVNACINANGAMVEDTLFVDCDGIMVDNTAISLTSGYGSNKWIIVRGVGEGRCTSSVSLPCYSFEHSANANGITITAEVNIMFDGLRFKFIQTNISSKVLFYIIPTTICKSIIINCVLEGVITGTSNNVACIYSGGDSDVFVINCVIFGFRNGTNTIIGVYMNGAACTTYVYNSNIVKGRYGAYRGASGTFILVNDYISTSTYPIYNFSGTRASLAVNDTTGYGVTGIIVAPFDNTTFTDTVTDDYTLVPLSKLINKGIHNLTLTDPLNYLTDLKNVTRTKNFDIGVFEYINDPLSFLPYSGPSIKCRTGVSFSNNLECNDIEWDSCTVDPIFQTGITLNKETGAISGTAGLRSSTTYRFYVWIGGQKEDSTTLAIRFYNPEVVSPNYYVTQTNHIGTDYLWYGINEWYTSGDLSTMTTYQNDLNNKIVRFDVYWYHTEPSNDVFNWDKTDSAIASIPTNCQILFTLYCTSSWGIKERVYDGNILTSIMPPTAPIDYNDYYDFVYRLATRYKGRVNYYQIENEVYAALPFWYGTAQEYLQLLQTGFTAIRAADQYAKVLASSIALATVDVTQPVPPNYEDEVAFFRMIIKSAVNYYDIVDMHLYYTLSAIPDRMSWLKTETALNRKPIWVTETGGLDERAYADYDNYRQQSIDMVKRYSLIFADTVDKVFWLHVYPPYNQQSPWKGITLTNDRYTSQKRPAYYTFKLLINKIDQLTSIAKLPIGTKFIVQNKPVLVLWNANDTIVNISSYINTSQALITHIITDTISLTPLLDTVNSNSVPIDSIPVFIEEHQ